jgi:hypothetical protein
MLINSKKDINVVKSPMHKQNTSAGSGSTVQPLNEIDEESETGKVKKSATQYVN